VDRSNEARQEVTRETRSPGPMAESAIRNMFDSRRLRATHLHLLVLGLAAALAVMVMAWLVLRGDAASRTILTPNGGAVLVSQAQLEQFADSVGHPVYWAGPKDGVSYELTETANGRIFIRYLPQGVHAGDRRPDFLAVGTYSQPSSFTVLQSAAKRAGAVSVAIDHGGLAVFNSKKPTSVYLGYPDAKYQIEVFAPSGETARSLVLRGKIKPIG
jgi:hypothetical protein